MTRCGNIELIERCSRGDAGAWRDLVERFRPAIIRVLVRVARAPDPAELCDLEQDVWARVLLRDRVALKRLRGESDTAVKAFLCTVAVNVARDAQRRTSSRPDMVAPDLDALEGVPDDPSVDPELRAAGRERQRHVDEAARAEVRDERDLLIFQMYYRDGASAPEIAAVPGLGLSTKGVEAVIHRVTQRVRRRLRSDA